jgi:hypothetical protein
MESMTNGRENRTTPQRAGCLKSAVGVGLGLALGALAGIVVGLLLGVGIAMIWGIL